MILRHPLTQGWTHRYIWETLQGDVLLFFLPVFCALPYASSFIDEIKSGMVKFALVRVKRPVYLRSKVIGTVVSGGMVVLCGITVFICVSFLLFLPMEEGDGRRETAAVVLEYGQLLCRYFWFGALSAQIGLWLSTLLNHRYMAWLSPFLMEYLLVIFCERYFPSCIIMNPAEWIKPERDWPWNGWSLILWLVILTIFTATGFWKAAKRRIGFG